MVNGKGPLGLDTGLHAWVLAHRMPGLTRLALAVTATGTGVVAYVLAALAGWFGSGGGAPRDALSMRRPPSAPCWWARASVS